MVVEGVCKGRGSGTEKYDNQYLMHFTVEEGKIVSFKEALDCYQVEAWFQGKAV